MEIPELVWPDIAVFIELWKDSMFPLSSGVCSYMYSNLIPSTGDLGTDPLKAIRTAFFRDRMASLAIHDLE